MLISLVICTYNRSDILKATLPSLLDLVIPDGDNFEIIIVDNNSSDTTKVVAEEFIKNVKSLNNSNFKALYIFDGNQGLSYARNTGYKESAGNYIAYIDDECILPETWLVEAKKIITKVEPAFLGGPYLGKYFPGNSSTWYKESFGDSYILQYKLENGPMKNRYISGGNMFIRRDVFEKVGLFDVNLGMSGEQVNYGEEVEFQKRFLEAYPDEIVWYDSKVFVWHCIREMKMKISFLFKDALIRGKSSAELQNTPKEKLRLAPIHLFYFIFKAIGSAIKKMFQSILRKEHYFFLLYSDYKDGTWRDIGGAWYKAKKFLGVN